MPSTDLIEYTPPRLLSLREVRRAGVTANRLVALRDALKSSIVGGTVTVKVSSGGQEFHLIREDIEAVISLLAERDVAFLSALNIETTE